ncbi:uncharacterized protein LOC103472338 isoform X2 [Poecilia reticulata]|uniref:uncharacterized protein LOC103472338 isoform X2 n=1 Tax=Poecilia reticulata TaxID=8081 RepID=UPI0004A367D7|nr:PREDICTED: uncharacterized protein LOC103472338 isoform X2 [Poecilia reticulata]XP_008420132.1 PREDICTED: uncharacterized protein LOC103472338 isoform X2 [Poecilia reticulata]
MSKMTTHKTTRLSFLLNEDGRVPLKVSQTNSEQNQVSILKKTANHNPAIAKPVAKSRVLKNSGTVSEELSSSCAAESKVVQKVCLGIRTSSTTADGSECSKVKSSAVKALPKTKMTCLASARIPEQPVKPTSTASSAKTGPVEKLVDVNTEVRPHQRNLPLSTQLNTISENEKLLKEPSNLPVSGAKQSGSLPKIGLNQLIIVSCQEKQQVYCRLCSVRLRTSTHSTSFTHCCNYVKMKYPGWTANLSEIGGKFKDIVAHLAEIEKSIESQKPQRIEVKKGFYLKLAALSEKEAIEELKTIERQDPRDSSSVAGTVQIYRQEARSPCEVSSSNDGEDCKAGTLTRDHLQTSASSNKKDQDHVPRSETKDSAETAKHDPFMPAIDAQPQSLMGSPRVKVEKVDSIFPPERILSKSHSPAQDAPKAGNCRPKVEMCSPQKRAESVQIKRTGLGHKVREAPMHDRRDELPPPPITCFGRKASGCSNLVLFLHARQVDTKRVIGMEFLWECRGICLDTFYLCESCEETVSNCDICQHVTSHDHQLKYTWKKHPEFLKIFLQEEDLPQVLKIHILQEVIWRLAERDMFQNIDAKCIILQQKLHQFVRMAHFSEALKIVQGILKEEEKSTIHLPLNAACQRSDEEITKGTVLEEMSNVGTSDVITKMDFSPVDMNCSSTKTDLVSSCVPNRRVEDAKPNPFQKPVLTSALALPQSSGQKLVPEETSCTAFGTKLNISVSGPTKKRPAVQTLHKTSSPSTDPLPPKRTRIMQKIKSEPASPNSMSPPVNLPAGPSLLGIKDEDSGPKQLQSTVNQDLFSKLTSHLKRITSKLAKDNIKTIHFCPTSSPAIPQTRWDAKIDNSGSVSYHWDSKRHLIQAPVRKNPPTNLLEGTKMVTSDLGCEKELVTVGLDSAPKTVSSSESLQQSVAHNVTEEKPITVLAPTADLFKLQDQQFFCRNESRFSYGCAATNPNSGQTPEPKCDPEPDGNAIGPLLNTTGADQPDPIKHMFQCSYTEQANTDINVNDQIGFHIDPPLRPTFTVATSGGCDPHVQADCSQMGNSCYPSYRAGQKQADASFSTESSHQPFIYSSLIYPQHMVNPFSLSPFRYHLTPQLPPGTGSFNTPYYPWMAGMRM